MQESRPEENELKSEAQFQRILASTSDHPLHQCQPRAPSDRGRYPEEVGNDEIQRPDTPSDGEADEAPFAYNALEPVAISKPTTPSPSLYNEDLAMIIPESPGGASMDIDMVRSAEDDYDVFPLTNLRSAVRIPIVVRCGSIELAVHTTADVQRCPVEQAQM